MQLSKSYHFKSRCFRKNFQGVVLSKDDVRGGMRHHCSAWIIGGQGGKGGSRAGGAKIYILRTVFVKILKHLSLSLSADLCIHSYWLSRLRQASHRKMNQNSALRLRLWQFKNLTCPILQSHWFICTLTEQYSLIPVGLCSYSLHPLSGAFYLNSDLYLGSMNTVIESTG